MNRRNVCHCHANRPYANRLESLRQYFFEWVICTRCARDGIQTKVSIAGHVWATSGNAGIVYRWYSEKDRCVSLYSDHKNIG